MKRRDLIAHLQRNRCELLREGAKHSWWWNPANGRRASVPRHREIGDGLVREICRQLGISEPYQDEN
ncbi:MAG: type II toxin-antitoxin system HicA family toxin [Planctomycetaceae bacterium]